MKPVKIISGGQTGGDQGGLEAGRDLGIKTGGTAPCGWLTETGPDPDLLKYYGLVEGPEDSSKYKIRTRKNVEDSDGTIWFGDPGSPGGRLTLSLCRELGKPSVINPSSKGLRNWTDWNEIKVLNVAGNRESKNPGIHKRTRDTIVEAFGD